MADEDAEMNEGAENEEVLEGEEGEGEDYDDEEGGGSKKLILIAGGAVVLLLGAGAGLYFTGMLDGLLGGSKTEEAHDGEHGDEYASDDGHGGEKGKAGGKGKFLEIPTILVNLSTEDGQPRYLRLTVQLEMASAEDLNAVEAVVPRVVDQFQTYLRELRVKDLRGSAGIYRLQTELLWRVNQAAAPVKVKDVLFQEILIQ